MIRPNGVEPPVKTASPFYILLSLGVDCLTGDLRCFDLRPLVARVLYFYYSDASFFFVLSDVEREKEAIAATASMHITLQIPLRIVLWQQLGTLWPLGGNTKEK